MNGKCPYKRMCLNTVSLGGSAVWDVCRSSIRWSLDRGSPDLVFCSQFPHAVCSLLPDCGVLLVAILLVLSPCFPHHDRMCPLKPWARTTLPWVAACQLLCHSNGKGNQSKHPRNKANAIKFRQICWCNCSTLLCSARFADQFSTLAVTLHTLLLTRYFL